MTDILCRWLNQDLRLSKVVEPHNLAKIFSNGYLIGEVLSKYEVQNDFIMFTDKSTSMSKINNFTRLESSFHLLGISFDISVAQALMQEKPGVAARLLYQLYFSLERKRTTQISGTIMEISQSAAVIGLHKKEQQMYSNRLHQVVKRDAELKLQKITHHSEERLQQWNEKAATALPIAAPLPPPPPPPLPLPPPPTHQRKELKVQDLQKVKMKKGNGEKVPKPPPYTSQISLQKKQQQHKARQAQKVQTEIAQFESNKKKMATYAFASSSNGQTLPLEVPLGGSGQEFDSTGSGRKLVLKSNCRYLREIRQRLLENAAAREQREKRLNRFLMEQLKAHEAQEEARRDEQLVKRLTRQTQLEQRLATQLLQMRRQKEVIRENRLFREQQYEERRERDFQEALEMEAALAQHVKSKRPEEIRKELEFCRMAAEKRVRHRYNRHFVTCRQMVTQIIDLVTLVGEYRLLNENQIPEKQLREWKELLLHGLPFFVDEQQPEQEPSAELVELEKQDILNNQDYDEYTNMVGEWAWPEEAAEAEVPPRNNDTLGHVVVRLRNLLHQAVETTPPPLPQFTFKACVLGKSCSGKSSCLARFAKAHETCILSADALIEEALNAHRIGEVIVPEKQDKMESELLASFASPSLESEEEGRGSEIPENPDQEGSELLKSTTSLTSDLEPEVGSKSKKVAEQKEKEKEQPPSSAPSKHGEPEKKSKGKDLKGKEQPIKEDTKPVAPSTTPKLKENEGNEIKMKKQPDTESQEPLAASTTPKSSLELEDKSPDGESRLSGRAIHGAVVENELKKGYAIPNELLVDVIVEAIRQIPAQSSWILDGFPSDVTQAELLRRALGGAAEKTTLHDRTQLVADPCPPKTPPPAPLVLDLAVLLDISDECVARRAYSHADAAAEASFHPTDVTLYQAQIPHRITFFHKTWPKLEKWLDKKLRILVRVDADVDEEELHRKVESVLQEAMQQKDDALSIPIVEYVVHDNKTPDSLSTTPSSVEPLPELTDKAAGSTDPTPDLREEKTSSLTSESKISKDSPRDLPEKTPTLGILGDHGANVKGTPESDITYLDPSGVYVHKSLPADVPESLSSHWDTICMTYVNNIKAVMQHLRPQRAEIDRRFYDMRGDYGHYLRRPDLKQEFVSEWQKYFNSSMWDSTRYDEQTKAELHLRLDELCERLWDISETRKEQSNRERDVLMHGGRLEDQAAVLVNHHAILLQVELDRFQATLQVLKVYYLGMRGDVLPELSPDILKVTLQEAVEIQDKQFDSAKKGQDPTEAIKQPNEKLISDHEETVSAISNLVLAETSKWEKTEDEADKEDKGAANKKKKAKPPPKKKKGDEPPAAAPDEGSENSSEDEVKTMIYKEYDVALKHEENATKVRMALVRGHSVALVSLLQRRAQQTIGRMQQWLEEHYQAEMKSIDQLSEVVRYYIESAEHLKNEMVLRGSEFFLMDVCCVENPAALRIIQLESLFQGFHLVSQSGIMPSSGLYKVLGDITCVHIENSKIPHIESLIRDRSDHIDWRRLLLSAALPWPSPSMPQLLAALEGFKAVDPDLTGYVNEDEYLQVELWLSDGAEEAERDSAEIPQSKRLAELRKFFFKLFADHSSLPSRLHYETMLRYFAADPDPREGFIRALSLVLANQVKRSSQDQLVQSMPAMEEEEEGEEEEEEEEEGEEEEEEEEEVESSEQPVLGADNQEEKTLDLSSASSAEQEVTVPALLAVIGRNSPEASHGQEQLVQIFADLNYGWEDSVPFSGLCQHPVFQALMEKSTQHQLIDIHELLLCCLEGADEEEQDESDSATSL